MKLEEAKEYLEQFIGRKKEYKYKPIKIKTMINTRQAIETVLQALDNSISKDKVKELLKDLKVPILIYGGRGNGRTYARAEKQAKIWILEKLLEDK